MTTMLDDLLDLARADAGRLELSMEDTSICDLVEGVAGMVGPIAQVKSLPLIAGVTVEVPDTVRTDPGRLRQVLLNLVSNAVKFSTSGAVTILADREGTDLVIRVSDTGPGMAPEAVGRAFEQYVQGGGRIHREFGGAGLALPSRAGWPLRWGEHRGEQPVTVGTLHRQAPGCRLRARAHPGHDRGHGPCPGPCAGRPCRCRVARARRGGGAPPR